MKDLIKELESVCSSITPDALITRLVALFNFSVACCISHYIRRDVYSGTCTPNYSQIRDNAHQRDWCTYRKRISYIESNLNYLVAFYENADQFIVPNFLHICAKVLSYRQSTKLSVKMQYFIRVCR